MTSSKSRRQFLLSSGALVLGSAGFRSSHGRAQSVDNGHHALFLNDPNSEENYWGSVRRLFSFDDSVVPMNAANLCPSFSAVTEFINQRTLDIDRDCSLDNRSKFYELHEQSRKLIAEQLNVGADEVALVRNTSEANNIVNNGIQLDAGDEILIWDQNHPTNNKGVAFTRPLCVYPKVRVYRGVGNRKVANNFECQDPSVPNRIFVVTSKVVAHSRNPVILHVKVRFLVFV